MTVGEHADYRVAREITKTQKVLVIKIDKIGVILR